jgi:hypothetical protein
MSEREEALTTADIAGQREGGEDTKADTPEEAAADVEVEGSSDLEPLLGAEEAENFRTRWTSIQTNFVDEPRQAVEQADGLVAELMQQLARTFSQERESLESQWSQGEDVSTEDLRVGLQRYRSFFERLLAT